MRSGGGRLAGLGPAPLSPAPIRSSIRRSPPEGQVHLEAQHAAIGRHGGFAQPPWSWCARRRPGQSSTSSACARPERPPPAAARAAPPGRAPPASARSRRRGTARARGAGRSGPWLRNARPSTSRPGSSSRMRSTRSETDCAASVSSCSARVPRASEAWRSTGGSPPSSRRCKDRWRQSRYQRPYPSGSAGRSPSRGVTMKRFSRLMTSASARFRRTGAAFPRAATRKRTGNARSERDNSRRTSPFR